MKSFISSDYQSSKMADGWKAYVDQLKNATPDMQHAGLFGQNGATWSASEGFTPTTEEIIQCANVLKKSEIGKTVKLAGTKYMLVNMQPEADELTAGAGTFRSVGTEEPCECVAALSKQALVVGIEKGSQKGKTNLNCVAGQKKYLSSLNY